MSQPGAVRMGEALVFQETSPTLREWRRGFLRAIDTIEERRLLVEVGR